MGDRDRMVARLRERYGGVDCRASGRDAPPRGFADWGQVFADQVVAGAIVDRLLHNATVLNVRGHSYRTRNYVDAQKTKGGAAATVR